MKITMSQSPQCMNWTATENRESKNYTTMEKKWKKAGQFWDEIVDTPCHQTGHFPPVSSFITANDPSYHRGITCKLQDCVVLVGGNTVMCEHCVEDGPENTLLQGANVCCGAWHPVSNLDRLRPASKQVSMPNHVLFFCKLISRMYLGNGEKDGVSICWWRQTNKQGFI